MTGTDLLDGGTDMHWEADEALKMSIHHVPLRKMILLNTDGGY
jgi:hypothetical protein